MYQIGVDIGGTNIKVGLVSETLELLQSCSVRFPHDGARSVVKTIEEAVNFLLQQQNIPRGQLESVGIVVPGSIDQTGFGQVVLALGLLLGQDVAFESVFALDLSGCRELETLLGTGFGF